MAAVMLGVSQWRVFRERRVQKVWESGVDSERLF